MCGGQGCFSPLCSLPGVRGGERRWAGSAAIDDVLGKNLRFAADMRAGRIVGMMKAGEQCG